MESREDFMSRCTKELTAKGKSEDEAHTCCEVAWDNRYNTTGSSVIATKKSDFMDTLNQDPRLSSNLLGMDDVILLGAMLYLWSSSGGSSYSYDFRFNIYGYTIRISFVSKKVSYDFYNGICFLFTMVALHLQSN